MAVCTPVELFTTRQARKVYIAMQAIAGKQPRAMVQWMKQALAQPCMYAGGLVPRQEDL